MGIASSSQVLANVIGPTTGGYVAAATGLRTNFFVTGVLLSGSLLYLRRFFVDLRGNDEPGTAAQQIQPADESPPI